ncbi:MAG TPA: hypothetical protein VFB38_04480 [Chthonomonadaceae bacterium]|nr:hypothetical protein [Chthonomonadaceae bacterium]
MNCRRLHPGARPASAWHRLWCPECRAAESVDAAIAAGIERMQLEPIPADGIARTRAAVGLDSVPQGQYLPVRRRAFRRLSLSAGLLAAALSIGGYAWWQYVNADPDIPVPTPTMPKPNAFDFYRTAGMNLRDDDQIGVALSNRRPQADKAVEQPQSAHKGPERPQDHIYSLAEKEALVRENASALLVLRQGLAYPYQEPPARSLNAVFPHLAKYRSLARLLALEAQTKAARGDWAGAVRSDLDAIEMGEQIPHGGILIGKLVGIACEAIGRKPLWKAIDHLNAGQARATARRLERIRGLHVPIAETLKEEKWFTLAGLQEAFRHPDWLRQWAKAGQEDPSLVEEVSGYLLLLRHSKRQILDNYMRYMDQAIACAKLPYAVPCAAPAVPEDPINRWLAPTFTQARFQDAAYSETLNALLLTALALRAYRLEHGAYPQTLSALVPAYLSQVPEDPFALYTALRYKRMGAAYLLYSIGPDGKDDGGVPINNPKATSETQRHMVLAESVGDIVAGINN